LFLCSSGPVPRAAKLPRHRADRLASELHLDVGAARICLACLSIVAFELESGNRRRIQGLLVSMTRDLWHEGLSEHAFAAVEDGCCRGLADAPAALADLEQLGGSSPIARAITLRLARQLLERAKYEDSLIDAARERFSTPFPELN
jgi:hypothetical protein